MSSPSLARPLHRLNGTPERLPGDILIDQVANGVEIIPGARVSPDTRTTVRLRSKPDAPPVLLHLSIAPDPERYTRHVMVRAEPREATCQQLVAPYIQREIDRRLDARLDAHTRKLALRTGHQLLSRAVYVPRTPVIDDSDALAAAPGLAAWFETSDPDGARTDFVWSFVLQSPRSVAVAAVRLRSHDGKERYPHVDMGAIAAGSGPTRDRSEPVAAHIPRDQRVTGVVYLPGNAIRETDTLTLEFHAPGGQRLASITANGFERSRAVELWSGDALVMRAPTSPATQATDESKGPPEPSPPIAGRCRAYEAAEAIIDRESGGTIDLAVTPGELSFVRLPDWLRLRQVRFTERAFTIQQIGNGVEIIPRVGVSLDTLTTIRLQTDRGAPPIMLRLSISPDPDRYTRHVTARDETLETTCQRLVAPYIEQAVARRFDETRESYTRAAILNTSRQILSRAMYVPRLPALDHGGRARSGVTAIPGAAAWIVSADRQGPHTDLMWAFALDNPLIQTLPIGAVRLRGPDGQEYQPDVDFDTPSVALKADNEAEATTRDHAVVNIPGQSRVTGVVRLADTPYQKDDPLTLEFLDPDGRRFASTTANGFTAIDPDSPDRASVTFYVGEPLTDEEIRRRDEAIAQRRRERTAKRISIHALGTFGWIWIPDGIADPSMRNKAQSANLTGFGLRVSKGIANWNQGRYYIAIEGEIAAASSGTARFQDITLDGAQGDLSRSVKLGRAQFGTALHLGDRIVPILRVGVGLQMISHNTVLMSDGEPTSTDSGVEFTQTLMFGAGVDWRLSAKLTAGIGIVAIAPRDDGLFKQTIEGGLHASYAWNP